MFCVRVCVLLPLLPGCRTEAGSPDASNDEAPNDSAPYCSDLLYSQPIYGQPGLVNCPDAPCKHCFLCNNGEAQICSLTGLPPDAGQFCTEMECDGPEDCLSRHVPCVDFETATCGESASNAILCHTDCDCPQSMPHCKKGIFNFFFSN
jgi:hypothetical protein